MYTHRTKIRVRYGETDQMGYMYHGNYAECYEVARVEMLRSIGLTYKSIEEQGIMMPVLEMRCKYIKPARYDEELTINVILEKMPGVKVQFKYEFFNEENELIHEGETTLAFIDMARNRPCFPPSDLKERLQTYFQ